MESEVLDERIEWEVRRVAAAFGVEKWDVNMFDSGWEVSGTDDGEILVVWLIGTAKAEWFAVVVGGNQEETRRREGCEVYQEPDIQPVLWTCRTQTVWNGHMVRGLYRLGFEDESVLSQLPQLTAHEKMELRLSMPREFWPQKWLDEERKGSRHACGCGSSIFLA